MRGHENFKIKCVSAKTLKIATEGLDQLFKSQGYFYLVDEGPSEDSEDYKTFLFATWTPIPTPGTRDNA